MRPNWTQKATIFQSLSQTIYPLQVPPLKDCSSRVILVTGGERGGKTHIGSLEALAWAVGFTDLIWLIGPDYEQARPEFENVTRWLMDLGGLQEKNWSFPKEGKCSAMTETGCLIETKTSEDVRKIAGRAPGLAIMTEAAQQTYDIFLKIRGRVAEKRGLLLMTGTLEEGSQWYADLYNQFQVPNEYGGQSYSVPSWANIGVYPGGENDPEMRALKSIMPESLFLERHAAIPRKPSLVVHPEFDHLHHVSDQFEYNPYLPVVLAIDPGFAGAYAVLACHVLGRKILCFDEIYETRPDRGTDYIIELARQRPWWKGTVDDRPGIERIVMDVAGKSGNAVKGKSISAMWHEATMSDRIGGERGIVPVGKFVSILDGIDRYRRFLGNVKNPDSVRVGYHPRCVHSIKEHLDYRYPKRRMSINRAISEKPVDAHNHSIKAMVYLIVDQFGFYDGEMPVTKIENAYNPRNAWLEQSSAGLPAEFI